jgi:hypothetical protein
MKEYDAYPPFGLIMSKIGISAQKAPEGLSQNKRIYLFFHMGFVAEMRLVAYIYLRLTVRKYSDRLIGQIHVTLRARA